MQAFNYPVGYIPPVGGGGGGGAVLITQTFDQDITAQIGGTFTPLADNANSTSQRPHSKTGAGTQHYNAATDPLVLVPSSTYGSYNLTGQQAFQANFRNNFTGVTGGQIVAVELGIIAYSLDAGGNIDAGFWIKVGQQQDGTGTYVYWNAYDLVVNPAAAIIAGSAAGTTGGQDSFGVYLDSATGLIGLTLNGVDNGPLQLLGVDYVFTFPTKAGFDIQRYITGAGTAGHPQNQNQISGALVLQGAYITEPVPAGYKDFAGNTI